VYMYKQVDAATGIPGIRALYNIYVLQHGRNCYVGLMEFCRVNVYSVLFILFIECR